ncbi:hypothetical protein APU03_00350 [Klebsiella pneumoniae]|nr:hypothetical protein APU03_00350 [Klebsiella pneumoniae]
MVFFGFFFFLLQLDVFFVQYEDFRDMQPATPEQLQSIIHDAPCAGEAFRMALQTALLQIVGGDKLIIPFC